MSKLIKPPGPRHLDKSEVPCAMCRVLVPPPPVVLSV